MFLRDYTSVEAPCTEKLADSILCVFGEVFFEILCVLRIPRESISFSGLQGFCSHLMVDLVNAYPLMV